MFLSVFPLMLKVKLASHAMLMDILIGRKLNLVVAARPGWLCEVDRGRQDEKGAR